MEGEEGNLTFFECLARSFSSSGRLVHDALLVHLARTAFEECPDSFEELVRGIQTQEMHHWILNPERCVRSAAIKQWVRRFNHMNQSVSVDVCVWIALYPTLLKTALLRFVWYHRNYAQKPHRLYCKYVFAHLAVEHYPECAVGIVEGAEGNWNTRWFYPLEGEDYFVTRTIVMRYERNGTFTLVKHPLDETVPLLLSPRSPPALLKMHSFILRCSRGESNVPVARFVFRGAGIYRADYEVPPSDEDIYQIYPGDENSTFYKFSPKEMMTVYCIVGKGEALMCATHAVNDQYAYFQAPLHTTCVVVVVAATTEECNEILEKHTNFTL